MASEELVDRDIRQRVWQGTVPVAIELSPNEVTTLEKPRPFFVRRAQIPMSWPRCSYLTLASNPVKEFFASFAPAVTDELWFEGPSGIPLKWHIPVGVLFDLYSNGELPLSVTAHFQSFPSESLLRCPGPNTVRSHFMNQLKESTHVKYGDTKKVNEMSMKETTDVWEGVAQANFDRFWSVNSKLISAVQRAPVRICRQDKPFLQIPAITRESTGDLATLGSLLKQQIPEHFAKESASAQVLIHGIELPLDTPLEWLSVNMSHPDGFLYVIVLPYPS